MDGALILLAVAFLSALIPVVNLEIYLGGMVLLGHFSSVWQLAGLAAIAAVGQLAGKTLFFFGGRGVLNVSWWRRAPHEVMPDRGGSARQTRIAARQARIAAGLSRWRQRLQEHPRLSAVFVGASASVGVPPFALVSVAAGALRISLPVFLVAGLAGRWARFAAVLALVQASGG